MLTLELMHVRSFAHQVQVLGLSFLANHYWGREGTFDGKSNSRTSTLLFLSFPLFMGPGIISIILPKVKDAQMISTKGILWSRVSATLLLAFSLVCQALELRPAASADDKRQAGTKGSRRKINWRKLWLGAQLAIVIVLVASCSHYLIDSIKPTLQALHTSESFLVTIVFAVIGNAVEHSTAFIKARNGDMEAAAKIPLKSSNQIGLLVSSFIVVLGWARNKPVTLQLKPSEATMLVIVSLLVFLLLRYGKNRHLQCGLICVGMYVFISMATCLHELTSIGISSLLSSSSINSKD